MGLIRLIHFPLFGPLRLKKGSQALLSLKASAAFFEDIASLAFKERKKRNRPRQREG